MADRTARFRMAKFIPAGALLAVLVALFAALSPPTELTRFRNSLIAEVGQPQDFNWTPATTPADFKLEVQTVPDRLLAAGSRLRSPGADILQTVNNVVAHLRSKPKRRGPIKDSTVVAYDEIIAKGRGYCADYTQVFNGLSHATSIAVREWGMSFDRYSGVGHAFNEVYDPERNQWIFVDPMNAFYVVDSESRQPLSVQDFRDRLAHVTGRHRISVVPINDAFLFDGEDEALDYYRNGADQFFLWFGNNVFTNDNHPLVRFFAVGGRPAEQLAAILLDIHPQIKLLSTSENSSTIQSLFRFRNWIISLIFVAAVLGLLVLAQLVAWVRSSRRSAGGGM